MKAITLFMARSTSRTKNAPKQNLREQAGRGGERTFIMRILFEEICISSLLKIGGV
jgi:hypothetical protein